MPPISVILADSQYLIRVGLRHLLMGEERFRVVAEATNEEDLIEKLRAHSSAQVVVLDYNQPDSFSRKTVEKVKRAAPSTRLLIISADNNKENIYQVLEMGVNSFLTKACDKEEIIDAIKATARGEKFFCTKVLDYLLEKSFAKGDGGLCAPTPLTPREIEIVRLIAQGLVAKEIAAQLNLSTHTVYTHRKNIMKKLGLSTASELVLYAVNIGLIKKDMPFS